MKLHANKTIIKIIKIIIVMLFANVGVTGICKEKNKVSSSSDTYLESIRK